jgi:hypothetical protein
MIRQVLGCTCLAGLAAINACRDTTRLVRPDDSGVDRAYVTGAAAAALDADGRFRLETGSGWQRPELSEVQAAALADVYAFRLAPTLPSWFERHRGAKIDFASLRRCGRAFYAFSPYVEPPDALLAGRVNAVASRWMFTYCDGEESPAISVAVATTATHLRIVNGRIDGSTWRGMEFHGAGIPLGTTAPILPERAAERLAQESGARVASVPRLMLTGVGYFPQSARWMLDLDRDVTARNPQGVGRSGRQFFVGRSLTEWSVGTYQAATAVAEVDTLFGVSGELLLLKRRSDASRGWESVEFNRGQP